MPDGPNVLLVLADQMRGDCVGADPEAIGDAAVDTPNLDRIAAEGTLFSRAYTPAPTCVPARRCLWTGQTPATNTPEPGGRTPSGWGGYDWSFEAPLPRLLRDAGYQTHLAGKAHSFPVRNHFGFEGMALHTGLGGVQDDYTRWLEAEYDGEVTEESHGTGPNDWTPRPWHLPERTHPTAWTTRRAEKFLEMRDPTRPFFLTVSYVRPHQPFDPPRTYWDRYIDRELPQPVVGDWTMEVYGDPPDHPPADAWHAALNEETVRRARAGYFGSVTHIDHQVGRLRHALEAAGEWANTLVVFASDHGEMLGDHHLWKKEVGHEGSVRVPLLVRVPDSREGTTETVGRPVGLEDLTPTVLDATDTDVPDTVEGRTLLNLRADPDAEWRDRYHGEVGPGYSSEMALQYLVDEDSKFIWNPVTGDELLFDLAVDPREQENLAEERTAERDRWRARLVERLAGRPEGFVENGSLSTVSPNAWA